MMKQHQGIRSLLAMALIGMVYAPIPAAADCELKLGVIAPLSGPAAFWGIAVRSAAEYGAAEANQSGGLQVGTEKCKTIVVAIDSKYTPEGAAAAANYMVSQRVKFIIGPVVTPELTAVKPIANRNELLLMTNTYAKDAIGPQWPLVFHVTPGPSAWADPIIRLAKETFGFKKVVLVVPNDQGGTDVAKIASPAYKKNGVEVIEEYYNRGITNFAPIVARILSSRPDAVDGGATSPGDAGAIVKQLRLAGFDGPIGRLGGPGTPEIVRIAGGYEVLKNSYWHELAFVDDKLRAIDVEYRRLLKADPPENTAFYLFVAATRMVTKAISKAGTITDTKKVAQALRSLPVEDPNLGKGLWIGQEYFGINQELSFPFGIGLVVKGKLQPIQRGEAPTGK